MLLAAGIGGAHIVHERAAAQNMKMQMQNALTGVPADIRNHTVAAFIHAADACNLVYRLKDFAQQRIILLRKLHGAAYMLFGHHQHMHRGAGRYVAKCIDIFIFKNLVRGYLALDYFAENAVLHNTSPFDCMFFDFIF